MKLQFIQLRKCFILSSYKLSQTQITSQAHLKRTIMRVNRLKIHRRATLSLNTFLLSLSFSLFPSSSSSIIMITFFFGKLSVKHCDVWNFVSFWSHDQTQAHKHTPPESQNAWKLTSAATRFPLFLWNVLLLIVELLERTRSPFPANTWLRI